MKSLKIFCLSLLILLVGASAHAFSSYYIPPDRAMGMVGKNGIVMEVQDSIATRVTLPNGWQADRCELSGVVYKGNAQHPAKAEPQTVVIHMLPAGRVKGLMACSSGMKGIYSIYGASKLGFSSIVGNENGSIPFELTKDGKLYAVPRDLTIRDKTLSAKFSQLNPQVHQALMKSMQRGSAQQAQTTERSRGPAAEEVRVWTKFLLQQYWPNQVGE